MKSTITRIGILLTVLGALCFVLGLSTAAFGQTVPKNVQKATGTNYITEDLVFNAKILTVNTALVFGDGVRQTFNPDATNAGLNVGAHTADPSSLTNGDVWYNSTDNVLRFRANGTTGVVVSGAPTDATYITQTTNGTLSAEQALSALATGIVQVTTTTGVLSSVTTSAGVSGLLSDETGSGALVFGTSPTITTPTFSGAIVFPDGVRQTFNPDGTTPGLNVGAHTADPSAPSNGDLWYDSTGNLLRARINGATVSLGAGGGGGSGDVVGPASATDNALVRFDSTTGELIQDSNVTLADSGTALVFTGAAGLTASGSNQNVTLTPSGTGVVTTAARITTTNTTASTTTATGSLVTAGGMGVAGDLYAGSLAIGAATQGTITNSSGNLIIAGNTSGNRVQAGAGSPAATFTQSSPKLMFLADSASAIFNGSVASATSTNRAVFQAFRSRGSLASPTAVVSGDSLIGINAGAYDGANMLTTGTITAVVDGTVSSAVTPARWEISTSPTDGSGTAVRLTVKSDGQVQVNTTTASTSTTTGALTVAGGTGVAGALYVGGILNIATSTPASASAAGVAGTIAWDASYIYICTATNTWERVAIATW